MRPVRAVELLFPAGALLSALAAAAAAGLRRRRARALPRKVERVLEAVPGSLGDAALVVDGEGRIARVNAAAALLAAAPPADVLGRPLSVLGPDLPVLAKGLARGPARALVFIAAVARALLAPHGASVEEEAAAGHGWRLRIVLPPAPAARVAGSDAVVA